MTDQHPITPPPELVKQWRKDWHFKVKDKEFRQYMAERAAKWDADQRGKVNDDSTPLLIGSWNR